VASKSSSGGKGSVLYVSGEENTKQIASRARRLGIRERELFLYCNTDADLVCDMAANPRDGAQRPALLVIDSIQTMVCQAGGQSSAGGVTQVSLCSNLVNLTFFR